MPFAPGDYNRRARIDLDAASIVGGPHAHMVLRITEDALPAEMLDLDGAIPCQGNGGDVRFSADQDGAVQLPFDLLNISLDNDPALSEFEGRVRATGLESGVAQSIYVWWRSTVGAQTQPASTEDIGRNAVYSSYAHAYGLSEDPLGASPQYVDRTGNGGDLAIDLLGTPTREPGIVSPFSSGSDNATSGQFAEDTAFSCVIDPAGDAQSGVISIWHRFGQRPVGNADLFEIQDLRNAPTTFVRFNVQKASNAVNVVFESDSGFQLTGSDESATNAGDIAHFAFVFLTDGTVRVYRNGVQVAQTNALGTPDYSQLRLGAGEFFNGSDGDNDEFFFGPTDGDTDFNTAWVQTYYEIFSAPASFFTPQAPEATAVTAQVTLTDLPTGTLAVLFESDAAGALVVDGADPTGYSVFDSITSTITASPALDYVVTDFVDAVLVLHQPGFLPKRIVLNDLAPAGRALPASALFLADRAYDAGGTVGALEVLGGGSVIGGSGDPLSYNLASDPPELTLRQAFSVGDLYSRLMENWGLIQRLWGEPFPMELLSRTAGEAVFGRSDGQPNGATFGDEASRDRVARSGWLELSPLGAVVRRYAGIQTTTLADVGFVVRAQIDPAVDAAPFAGGPVRQAIRYDTGPGDHLVVKTQRAGWRPTTFDVLAQLEEATVAPRNYAVGISPIDLDDLDGSDPGAFVGTVTVEATPVLWNGLSFSITIQTTDSAAALFARLNYALSQGGAFQGLLAFNWPEMIVPNGDSLETARGEVIGTSGPVLKGVRIVGGDGTTSLPGVARMQSDDGTYYVPPVQVSLTFEVAFEGSPPADFEWRLYDDVDADPNAYGTEVPGTGAEAQAGGASTIVYAYDAAIAGEIRNLQIIASGFRERVVRIALPATSQTVAVDVARETEL